MPDGSLRPRPGGGGRLTVRAFRTAAFVTDLAIVATLLLLAGAQLGDGLRVYLVDAPWSRAAGLVLEISRSPGDPLAPLWRSHGRKILSASRPDRPLAALLVLLALRVAGTWWLAPAAYRARYRTRFGRAKILVAALLFLGAPLATLVGEARHEKKGTPAPQLFLEPVAPRPSVRIRLAGSDSTWLLRLPEYAYLEPRTRQPAVAGDVEWTVTPDGKEARFAWAAEESFKRRVGVDFHGVLTVRGDRVEFRLTGKNLASSARFLPIQMICLQSAEAPRFVDVDAARTFVHRGGAFVAVHRLVGGKFAPDRMVRVPLEGSGARLSRLVAKEALGGGWVLGLAVDRARNLFFNFSPSFSCIHSDPVWPLLKPGESATAEGRLYLLEGSLEALWRRYVEDSRRLGHR